MVSLFCLAISGIANVSKGHAQSNVPFSTGFEDVQDWKRSRPAKGSAGYDYPAAWADYNGGNPIYPPPKNISNLFEFDLFRVGATLFDPLYVTNQLEVGDGIGRNSGRGMLYNVEVSGSNGTWTGGDAMHMWLGSAGHKDLYVRFYLKYPPEWKWTNDLNPIANRGAFQKIMKIARYNGAWGDGGNPTLYTAPQNGGKVHPVWIPDWYQYISTTPSQTYYYNSERYSPDYTSNDPVTDFYSNNAALYPQRSQLKWPSDSEWHCYEFRAKMNSTPGATDGVSEIWLDGVKVWSKTNVAWVKAGGDVSQGWNDVTILDNATIPAYPVTSHVTYPLYLDDVMVSTTYSGPPAKPVNVTATAGSNSVKVAWSAGNNGATYDIDGYRVYYGTNPSNLDSSITVSNVTQTDITGLSDGTYYFAVAGFNKADSNSNENESLRSASASAVVAATSIPAPADSTLPVASISAPTNGSTVSGTVTVNVAASDNVGVSKVEFYLNGSVFGVIGAAPYSLTWNTTSNPNGSYVLTAKAYDAAGNVGQSSLISVNVNNVSADSSAPVISSFTMPASSTSLTVPVTALSASDNLGVAGYLITESATAPAGSAAGWNASSPANFTFAATGSRTAYAWSKDAAGNVSAAKTATVSITAQDATAPTVAITSPAYGSTVSGTAAVVASASDNVAVSKVEFYVNGSLKATSTAAPYTFNWNTLSVANGAYTVSAKASDAAGNASILSNVTLYVANSSVDTTAPVVSLSSPSNSTVFGSKLVISGSATDNVAVTKIDVFMDGSLLLSTNNSSFNLNRKIGIGTHTITVKAYDAAKNVGTISKVVTRQY